MLRDLAEVVGLDQRIAVLAGAQEGAIGFAQLIALDASRHQIARRRDRSLLIVRHRGVYSIGHHVLSLRGEAIAALLAVPGSMLSHQSAAALWGIQEDALEMPHVTGPTGVGKRRTLRVHASRSVAAHAAERHGLPLTKVPRTLLDLASTLDRPNLARAVREARVKGLVGPDELHAAACTSGHHGAVALARVLGDADVEPTRSQTERRLLRLLLDAGLRRPQVNAVVLGRERDFAWPDHRLIVETDDYNTHGTPDSFEGDRDRDAYALAHGWTTLRETRRCVRDEPLTAVARIAAALALRAAA